MTLSDMAREIERRKPDALPQGFFERDGFIFVWGEGIDGRASISLSSDIAEAVLRDAMVRALLASGYAVMRAPIRVDSGRSANLCIGLSPDADNTEFLFGCFCAAFPFPEPTK